MAMVYRANQNLTKMTDAQLNALVICCVARGVDFADVELNAPTACTGRKAVRYAAAAIDLLEHKLTATTRQEPSEESRAWSSWEGGHVHHERPDIETILFKSGETK